MFRALQVQASVTASLQALRQLFSQGGAVFPLDLNTAGSPGQSQAEGTSHSSSLGGCGGAIGKMWVF